LQGEEQRGEVPVPIVKGDVKRATRPFEDKVKKVQKAPRLRPLLGPGSSRSPSPGGKGGKRQEKEIERRRSKAKREGERDERHKRGLPVALSPAGPCGAAAAAAVTTRRLALHAAPPFAPLSARVPWGGGRFCGGPG